MAPALAAPPVRWHFEMPGDPPFTYSVLFARGPEGDETRLLLQARGARLELLSTQDPSERDSTESVADADTKERLSRRLLLSGYDGVAACAAVRPPDACLVFSGARGTVAAGLSEFAGARAPALRSRLAALVTPGLDAKLETLAAVFPRTAELVAYGDDFLRLVWPGRFPRPSGTFARGRRVPGCAFDASFGYPCGAADLRRDRALAK